MVSARSERAAAEAAAEGAVKRRQADHGDRRGAFLWSLPDRAAAFRAAAAAGGGRRGDRRPRRGQPARHRERRRRDAGALRARATRVRLEGLDGVGREVARRAPGAPAAPAGTARDPAAVTKAAREISTALDAELDDLGRRAFSMLEIPRRAPRHRQAGRPAQLPDQLHAEPVEARRRGGLPLRDDGRRAGARSRSSRAARR